LAAYDAKWFLLPSKLNYAVVGLGVAYATIVVLTSSTQIETLLSVVAGAGILSGIYAILHFVSKGRLIGFGDVILGLGLALLLADWRLAFIALFAANVVGCLVVIPGVIAGTLKRTSHVPFGPLLIAGWLIAGLWGTYIIDFYSLSLL
jgi:prepilin signal peptidase PulO-like enzyme (type II secretory pathway)